MSTLSDTLMIFTDWHLEAITAVLVFLTLVVLCAMIAWNRLLARRIRQRSEMKEMSANMMNLAIKISGNNVVRLDLRDQHIYQLYGHLLPDEGISIEEWKKHLHPDDYEETVNRLRLLTEGLVKQDEFYYRWNFDYSGGKPRWGYIHDVSIAEFLPGMKRPFSIINTLRDETEIRKQVEEEEGLTSKYKLIFEQSIIGLSFYTPDGWLLDANKIMRDICHFDSEDFDNFFSKANLFDQSPFHECVDRNNIEELWICSQSIIPERNIHDYLEIHMHPIRDDIGQIIYLTIAVRDVSEERNMYLQAKKNDLEIQKVNKEIKQYNTELRYMMEACEMQTWRISLERDCIEFYRDLSKIDRSFPLSKLQSIFVNQTDDFVKALSNPAEAIAKPLSYVGQMYPVVTLKYQEPQWVQINCIPEHNERGELLGAFGVWRNITNLMKKQEQLKRETERANDSGRLKSVFLANMTHEIRTPLNAIVGFSDLLQMIDAPEEKREMIRVIHNNCDMLLRLINDILVLSNVDANVMQIVPENVDFAREFEQISISLAQRIQEPGVEFLKDNPYDTLPIRIDNGRIQQVITNFVTNAVKYTHQGHIRIGYRLEERDGLQGLYVYCEDTGAGIPKDQLNRVFERFVKLNDFIQGTGLGLSICKAIIERCKGSIGVDSEVGQGSTFWFWIPV